MLFVLVWLVLTSVTLALPAPARPRSSKNRANERYDYIVVGCGISGLVAASRLSEDSNTTVLCIESGALDDYDEYILAPAYIGQQPPGFCEWGIDTVPQHQLDGKTRRLPMGRGVGGGSLINGMIWNRGNQDDFDLWTKFGNPGWGWEDILPYFRKTETYSPRHYPSRRDQPVTFDPKVHGFGGPVQVSYPSFYWEQSNNWFDALNELGLPTSHDPNQGLTAGAYFLPISIDPKNQTRSDARRTYHDAARHRPNYNVMTNTQVVRVAFDESPEVDLGDQIPTRNTLRPDHRRASDSLLHAIGVEIKPCSACPPRFIRANQEVILAAGALHSPQILELSGIGSAELLQSLDIAVLVDNPGVGANLQDHALIHLTYPYVNNSQPDPSLLETNATFRHLAREQYLQNHTGPFTAKPLTALAFPSLSQIADPLTLDSLFIAARNMSPLYPPSYEAQPTLKFSHHLQVRAALAQLLQPHTPAYEILNNNAGALDLSLMRPLSRGTTHITSRDPLAAPAVDPRWLSHPFDFEVMLLAMEFNQRILDTAAIRELGPTYPNVPANASRETLGEILRRGIGTEFHYAGTTAMLPRSLGGVVSPRLVVYGTDNLRVVDSGIFPISAGAHLQAVVYAVAEKAADVIKEDWAEGGAANMFDGVGIDETRAKEEQMTVGPMFWDWFWRRFSVEQVLEGD